MEWINLHTSVLDSPEFVGEEPVNQASWLKLLRFCIGQENGGRILGCRPWKDRKWQQLVRVTKREVEAEAELWEWDGDDLIVRFYPIEKETEIRAKRETARANGASGGRPKKHRDENPEETDVGFSSEPTLGDSEKAEGKGREGNGNKEGKGSDRADVRRRAETLVAACPFPDLTIPALEAAAACIGRHPDRFDEILDACKKAAAAVRSWPENERIAFRSTAERFFREDQWRRSPESWESRRAARTSVHRPTAVDIGNRKPELLNLDD